MATRKCPFCTTPIARDASVCPHCTRNVGGWLAPAGKGTVVLVLLLVVAGIFGMRHLNRQEEEQRRRAKVQTKKPAPQGFIAEHGKPSETVNRPGGARWLIYLPEDVRVVVSSKGELTFQDHASGEILNEGEARRRLAKRARAQ